MGTLTNTLVKGSPANEAPPPFQEFCPECGEFVSILHELSGWCISCSRELGYKVTAAELRAVVPSQEREACFNGHPYKPGTWYLRNGKGVRCLICDRISSKRKRAKAAAELASDPNSPRHGTLMGARSKCQCAKCKEARDAYNLKRKLRRTS